MILVAGGSGFIGSAVVKRLLQDGSDVAVMTAHPTRSRPRIKGLGARMVEGDVQDAASLGRAAEGARAVIQCLTFPTFPVEKPSKGYTFDEYDHRGTERLVKAAAAAGAQRFVFCSGSGAAPDADKVWHRAKWAGEEAIRATGIGHAIIRPSWVYGPEDRALNRFLFFARFLPFVPVIGDGRQRVQPVFVEDVAEAMARAARPEGPDGTFEIGGPEVLSMNEVIRTALDVMGRRRALVHFPAWMPKLAGFFLQALPKPPLSPDAVDFATGDALADTASLRQAFDLEPRPLRRGLAAYLS